MSSSIIKLIKIQQKLFSTTYSKSITNEQWIFDMLEEDIGRTITPTLDRWRLAWHFCHSWSLKLMVHSSFVDATGVLLKAIIWHAPPNHCINQRKNFLMQNYLKQLVAEQMKYDVWKDWKFEQHFNGAVTELWPLYIRRPDGSIFSLIWSIWNLGLPALP